MLMTKRLEDALADYAVSRAYPFHMPGHKRRPASCQPAIAAAMSMDITEIDGFDNLHAPQGLLKNEMEFASRLFGSQETFFSVNGSTGAILAAISAAAPFGSKILIERRCHISVYHAAYLRDLKLQYIDERLREQIELPSARDRLGAAGRTDLAAVVITSPSYEGFVKKVSAWADYAHSIGAVLIVDEAHGAHFSMHPYFPPSAIRCGADLVVQSLHKTLPALTQTALLHRVTDRVGGHELRRFLTVYETSSPSYLLMASITGCLHEMAEKGQDYFSAYANRLQALRKNLAESLQCLRLEGNGPEYDPGKILITAPAPCTGADLYRILRETYQLQPEMHGEDYVLLMTSVADTEEGFARLTKALSEIDAELQQAGRQAEIPSEAAPVGSAGRSPGYREQPGASRCPFGSDFIPPAAMRLSIAADAPRELLPLQEAEGRISADYILIYPPDSPLVVPGEVFTKETLEMLRRRLGPETSGKKVAVVSRS